MIKLDWYSFFVSLRHQVVFLSLAVHHPGPFFFFFSSFFSPFFVVVVFLTHGFPSFPLSTSPAPQYLCPFCVFSFTSSLK